MGTGDRTPHYILSPDSRYAYLEEETELFHRQHWEDVFTNDVTDDDDVTENTVNHFLAYNLHRVSPHDTADLTQLNTDDNPLVSAITNEDIYNVMLTTRPERNQ